MEFVVFGIMLILWASDSGVAALIICVVMRLVLLLRIHGGALVLYGNILSWVIWGQLRLFLSQFVHSFGIYGQLVRLDGSSVHSLRICGQLA